MLLQNLVDILLGDIVYDNHTVEATRQEYVLIVLVEEGVGFPRRS